MSGFFNGSTTVKKYIMTFLLALLITVVFYISVNLIDFNPIEYATGFVFGLSFTLIFKKQSNSSKIADLLGKQIKACMVREIRRGGLFAPDQDTKDLESCKKRFKDRSETMKIDWPKNHERP
ncbi:TPA: hypothetical protein NU789_003065 [Acinetobacter baumannii]|uniref:hypothetical protein n=2 Tax=Acinetobacter baumannii TaxID=470 RepID=UPI0002BBDCDD|nr:hypothetical protein [Acinetobacter baumannii]EJB8468715.1 hypothetical protein [Acinetobacter baumannii]EKW5259348.1 hypothetical protein [Acinetobacter baumannii]ELN4298661.1 hypothetical protein [Acinetobacter baumannii]MBV6561323.1 hypothetical protein [Acinetobacter baumannii]MCR0076857.1 hypothetical protein [Acinetobacter baumannii]